MQKPAIGSQEHGEPDSTVVCYTVFRGHRLVASGPLPNVVRAIKRLAEIPAQDPVLVFSDLTGGVVDIDLRGAMHDVVERVYASDGSAIPEAGTLQKRNPGRPKLGVIAREVTLLPAQWEWLDAQPGGASAALRRLVYAAKRSSQGRDCARQAQEAVYRFMTTMAGNFPGFEEALRSFYRREDDRFDQHIASWPIDVRKHVKQLVGIARRDEAAA